MKKKKKKNARSNGGARAGPQTAAELRQVRPRRPVAACGPRAAEPAEAGYATGGPPGVWAAARAGARRRRRVGGRASGCPIG